MHPKAEDLTDQKFGRLTALEYAGSWRGKGALWRCQCECGNIATVRADKLKSGRKHSCGCLTKQNSGCSGRKNASVEDLTGQRFGRLAVLDYAGRRQGHGMWRCQCDCGGMTTVRASDLKRGHIQSCGCLAAVKTIHSGWRTRLYGIWCGMKDRCSRPKHKSYQSYGGKGIAVCDEWRNDFSAFRDWAMANGYDNTLTIDRIDNDGDYCPENCQFLTKSENSAKQWTDKAAA